jgi:hypothetical protein
MAQVASIAATHISGDDGTCVGCQSIWNRWVSHPCVQAEWAASVQAFYAGNGRDAGNQICPGGEDWHGSQLA